MASCILKIYFCFLLTGKINRKLRMLMWRLRKISIMRIVCQNHFLLRNISIVGVPNSMVLVIISRVFMWPLSLMNAVPIRIIHLQCFEMVSLKTRSSYIDMVEDGTPLLSSDSEMTSKENRNIRATFKIQMR